MSAYEDEGAIYFEPDEPIDGEPEESNEPGTYSRWDLWTQQDGRVNGRFETNDDNDDGYIDSELVIDDSFNFESLQHAVNVTGHSRYGILSKVTVYLDGEELTDKVYEQMIADGRLRPKR